MGDIHHLLSGMRPSSQAMSSRMALLEHTQSHLPIAALLARAPVATGNMPCKL